LGFYRRSTTGLPLVNEGSAQNDAVLEGGNAGEGGGTSHGKGVTKRGSARDVECGGDLGGTVHIQFSSGLVGDNIPVATHGTNTEFAHVVHQHGDTRAVGEGGNGVSARLGDLQGGGSAGVGHFHLFRDSYLCVGLDEIAQEVDGAVNVESTANVNAVIGRARGNVQITRLHGDGVGEGRSDVVGSVNVDGVGGIAHAQLVGDLDVSTEGGIQCNRHLVAEGGGLGNREFAGKNGVAGNLEVVSSGDLGIHAKGGVEGGGASEFKSIRASDLAGDAKGGREGGGPRHGKGGRKGGGLGDRELAGKDGVASDLEVAPSGDLGIHAKRGVEGGSTRDFEGIRARDLASHTKGGAEGGSARDFEGSRAGDLAGDIKGRRHGGGASHIKGGGGLEGGGDQESRSRRIIGVVANDKFLDGEFAVEDSVTFEGEGPVERHVLHDLEFLLDVQVVRHGHVTKNVEAAINGGIALHEKGFVDVFVAINDDVSAHVEVTTDLDVLAEIGIATNDDLVSDFQVAAHVAVHGLQVVGDGLTVRDGIELALDVGVQSVQVGKLGDGDGQRGGIGIAVIRHHVFGGVDLEFGGIRTIEKFDALVVTNAKTSGFSATDIKETLQVGGAKLVRGDGGRLPGGRRKGHGIIYSWYIIFYTEKYNL